MSTIQSDRIQTQTKFEMMLGRLKENITENSIAKIAYRPPTFKNLAEGVRLTLNEKGINSVFTTIDQFRLLAHTYRSNVSSSTFVFLALKAVRYGLDTGHVIPAYEAEWNSLSVEQLNANIKQLRKEITKQKPSPLADTDQKNTALNLLLTEELNAKFLNLQIQDNQKTVDLATTRQENSNEDLDTTKKNNSFDLRRSDDTHSKHSSNSQESPRTERKMFDRFKGSLSKATSKFASLRSRSNSGSQSQPTSPTVSNSSFFTPPPVRKKISDSSFLQFFVPPQTDNSPLIAEPQSLESGPQNQLTSPECSSSSQLFNAPPLTNNSSLIGEPKDSEFEIFYINQKDMFNQTLSENCAPKLSTFKQDLINYLAQEESGYSNLKTKWKAQLPILEKSLNAYLDEVLFRVEQAFGQFKLSQKTQLSSSEFQGEAFERKFIACSFLSNLYEASLGLDRTYMQNNWCKPELIDEMQTLLHLEHSLLQLMPEIKKMPILNKDDTSIKTSESNLAYEYLRRQPKNKRLTYMRFCLLHKQDPLTSTGLGHRPSPSELPEWISSWIRSEDNNN